MKDMDLFNGTSAEEPTPMVGLGTPPPFPRAALSDFDLIEEIITQDDGRSGVLPASPTPPPPAGLFCHTSLNHNHNHNHRSLLHSPPSCPRPVLGSLGTAFKQNLSAVRQPACSLTNMASAPPPPQGTTACLLASRSTVSSQSLGDINILERVLEKPRFVVVEEPKDRGMRFRYECEGRSAGSILGASSTDSNKTQPAIEIQGPIDHIKQVTITVSLVTKDLPHRPHPHCLVGKDCPVDSGICVVSFNPHSSRRHSFANLGIQCVKRKDLDLSLQKRRSRNIDPFQTGHTKGIEDMDMNAVRLCFQCELDWTDGRKDSLSPVVSKPIYDKKATTTSQLKISLLNQYRGSCTGKTEIYMLCDKVQKDDIEIIFRRGSWKANGEFALTDVHRQIAIVFKTPPYQDPDISEEVAISVVLRRISDQMESEPVTFTYLPHNQDLYGVKRKRANIKSDMSFKEKHCVVADSLPSTEQAILYLLESQNTLSQDERPHLAQAAGPSMEETPYTEAQNPNANPDEINQLLINQLLELPEFSHLFSDTSITANVPCSFDSAPPVGASFPNTSLNFNQNFGSLTQDFSHYSDLQFNMLVNENQNQQPEQPDVMVQVKTEEEL